MNTITQIENALKAINQASFQTLVNHLLYLQGNKFIGAPGTVVGKDKTSKGTPDSFFVNNEKYIFVECTTQERLGGSKSFFDKLSKDIDHCFKEDATTIEKEKIEKVILACNEKISTKEHKLLNTKVKSYNPDTEFEILNIQNLPYCIFEIPKLAEEYLGIQIVKGDIYTLEDFLLKTKKGLQPSLTNEFIGREEELKNSIEALKKYDILLLTGSAGVGKSKLAVKILEELSKDNYVPIVIQSSAVSLWDDYQHLFLTGKKHIVLFDDANKSIKNLDYLLSKLEDSKSYSFKIIITSRDYVKKQVSKTLENYRHRELSIKEFKDEEIGKIIIAALPNLQYHSDIKRKIVDLAKGNARVALMATYSVTPDSETNYLSSPVLLYEKYFKKISEEIGIFNNPIILKSLAIVSFFGVLDRNNEELKTILSNKFDIEWNELWTAIMELHNSEILDVYSNEIVKVSDQVLATYAFYKCFIDEKSAVINYAEWIATFIKKFSNRIRATLIDVNNTFVYYHIRDLVLPHLNKLTKQISLEEQLYAFYNLFWFYKGRDCLLYLKKWIENLTQQEHPEKLTFSYVYNDHPSASRNFEILRNFWNHPNEFLRPSLVLTLDLLNKQPNRLSEILKFIHSDFKYTLEDKKNGYQRQNILFDVLLNEQLNDFEKSVANGIFLNISEVLLGWHYTEYGSAQGHAFTIYNFDLYKSDELMKLRERILNQVYDLFESENEQMQKILQKIIYPDGDIDKNIYVDELPIYKKLISEKLDNKQYEHCKFVRVLAKHLSETGTASPENWNKFIESDVRKLHKFLTPYWLHSNDKTYEEFENEKREEFDSFVKATDWQSLKKFLLNIDALYKQQKDNNGWHIESAVTDIYISIARKNKSEFDKALRLYLSSKVTFPLNYAILDVLLSENIITGKDFLNIINNYDSPVKSYWEFTLLTKLPKEQIDESFLKLLIDYLKKTNDSFYINRMINYSKYEMAFNIYKKSNPELKEHNLITYLTSLILNKSQSSSSSLGYKFCSDCAPYFINHLQLFKNAYWHQLYNEHLFDLDGKELKSVLNLDKNFLNESLKNEKIGLTHSSKHRLEKINTDALWEFEEYETLIEDILQTIVEKERYLPLLVDNLSSIFNFKKFDEVKINKAKALILKIIKKQPKNNQIGYLFTIFVYEYYNSWFIDYYREFLLIYNDINLTKKINFNLVEVYSGSRVPLIQKKIELYQKIIEMINALPNFLDYHEHLDYFEQQIEWKKIEIKEEEKQDFKDEFY